VTGTDADLGIGIFGSDAGPNPAGPNACQEYVYSFSLTAGVLTHPSRGCDIDTLAMGWGSGTANFPYLIDPLSAINAYVSGTKSSVVITNVTSDTDYDAITAAASTSDVCLVFVNADSGEGVVSHSTNASVLNPHFRLYHCGR
jgi:beta-glucosidase